ncbi:MAG: tRNA lysidine(34) synthetase TilS [Clostridium sp.]|nr:tRNA lysidine(34) synthetase TilS [Clostridium sp.]
MINKVKNFLKKYELNSSEKIFIVGFSGGYDSMCLLDILHRISEKTGFKLIALHLNHNWRGREAEIEQENCEKYCKTNNIEFYSEILPEEIQKTETIAREKRQEFFKKCYKKYNADALFLAHTKSDNTETILYRLTKGTGVKGLCGILEHSKLDFCEVYRPLMNSTRKDILKYCTLNRLVPNNDSSNSDIKYARNFIRHQIISELKTINPKIDDVFWNLSQIAISEQNIIKEYMALIKKDIEKDDFIVTCKFVKLSKDIQNKFILDFLINMNLDYDSKKVEEIYEFINKSSCFKSGKTLSLAKDLWLFVSKEKICTIDDIEPEKITEEVKIQKCGEFEFHGKIFKLEKYKKSEMPKFPKENEFKAYVNIESDFELTLRTRLHGDIIQPFGMSGTMKLKKLFINKGVEKFKRDDIILLCKDNEILWAAGICLSEKLRAQNLPTHILTIKTIENR